MSDDPESGVELVSTAPEATRAIGASLAGILEVGDLLVLNGDLGAGKTCLSQGIGRGLGVDDRITSPTFTIAAQYDGRLRLHHLDVYRLDDPAETIDLDLPELQESGVVVIEWGGEIDAVLPAERLTVTLSYDDAGTVSYDDAALVVDEAASDDLRCIELSWAGPSWERRAEALRSLSESSC